MFINQLKEKMSAQDQGTNPQPTKDSTAYRIGDLEAQDAQDFFDDNTWHLNGRTTWESKAKTSNGNIKFAFNLTPTRGDDGKVIFATGTETKITTRLPKTSGNGATLPATFKFKGGKITSHFDLGFLQFGNHWVNPYTVLNIPTKFTNITNASSYTLGALLHLNLNTKATVNLNFNLETGADGKAQVSFKENATAEWKDFTLNALVKAKLAGPAPIFNEEVNIQWSKGPNTIFLGNDLTFGGNNFNINSTTVGLTHQLQDNTHIAATATKEHGENGALKYNIGVGSTYKGFETRTYYNSANRIGFLAKFNIQKGLDASVCIDKKIKENDFVWGLKFTNKF